MNARVVAVIAAAIVLVGCTHTKPSRHESAAPSAGVGSVGAAVHGGVSSIWIEPQTVNSGVGFCRRNAYYRGYPCHPLNTIIRYFPRAWPTPPPMSASACPNVPYKVIVVFADRTRFVYGPCAIPDVITRLRNQAMLLVEPLSE